MSLTNDIAGTIGGWLMGSRGCLLEVPHLILDQSNNQFPFCSKFGIIFIYDSPVVQRRGEGGGVVGMGCVSWWEWGI